MRSLLLFVLVLMSAATSAQEPRNATDSYQAILAKYYAELAVYRSRHRAIAKTAEYKKLQEADDRAGITALRDTIPGLDKLAYSERFARGAKSIKGTDQAVPFLTWLCKEGKPDQSAKVLSEDSREPAPLQCADCGFPGSDSTRKSPAWKQAHKGSSRQGHRGEPTRSDESARLPWRAPT